MICLLLVTSSSIVSLVVQRKKTLLKEYEQSGKASVFLDKRIGEGNEEMGEFQKALFRSQREYKVRP